MPGGLVGAHLVFRDRYGRLGRASVGGLAAGIALIAVVRLGSVVAFARAGFRPVPSTGSAASGLMST